MLVLLAIAVANVTLLVLQIASVTWLTRRGRQIYTPRDLRLILGAVPRGETEWLFIEEGKSRFVVVDNEIWVDARPSR